MSNFLGLLILLAFSLTSILYSLFYLFLPLISLHFSFFLSFLISFGSCMHHCFILACSFYKNWSSEMSPPGTNTTKGLKVRHELLFLFIMWFYYYSGRWVNILHWNFRHYIYRIKNSCAWLLILFLVNIRHLKHMLRRHNNITCLCSKLFIEGPS